LTTAADILEAKHRLEEARLFLDFVEARVKVLSELAKPQLDERVRKAIEEARWTERNHGSFAWAFVNKQDGSARPEVRALVEAIESSANHAFCLDQYEYTVDGKFLHRKVVSR